MKAKEVKNTICECGKALDYGDAPMCFTGKYTCSCGKEYLADYDYNEKHFTFEPI